MSAIEPGPWWPAIGMPLTAVMLTAVARARAGVAFPRRRRAGARAARPRSASGPTPTGTRASPARACRPVRSARPGARRRACGRRCRAAKSCSSCRFDSSSTWPTVGEVCKERVLALGPEDRGVLQRHPAVEDRLGIDQRRPQTGRADLEEHVRFATARRAGSCPARAGAASPRRRLAPTWPSTVPAITCTPARSVCR